ncbi:hypothetical protein DVA67_032185 [Solirubrobacter sp. CPCC 204708]|uniref:Uncharacterized protein n=1 Tax=Solirubrobacter deserti TaxID=2282478 RepID=A0ABT4RW04_9ACTN|nr:hypothetical protein [Solirubrobacter deserti]MBE2320664.1 hypothetical protein [Solirubrobacter deserti]MDA0142431.1 hypothetical protein [Solirubrobacter deserti]
MFFLLTLARLPTTTAGRVAMPVVWAAAAASASATESRSLAVMAPLGFIVLLHGWATLTNWGGTWDRVVEAERRRDEAGAAHPLGRTRAGRAVRMFNRQDDQVSRGLSGAMALIIGPIFIVLGVLALIGVFRPVT